MNSSPLLRFLLFTTKERETLYSFHPQETVSSSLFFLFQRIDARTLSSLSIYSSMCLQFGRVVDSQGVSMVHQSLFPTRRIPHEGRSW